MSTTIVLSHQTPSNHAQCLWALRKRRARFGALLIILLYKPNAEDKDVALAERYSLRACTGLQLSGRDGMCRPGIVGECTAVLGVVLDEVEEYATTADAVLRPVYTAENTVSGCDCVDVKIAARLGGVGNTYCARPS